MSKIVVRQRTVRVVEFVCPRCGLDRPGTEVALRRWWHLAGVPILPLHELDRAVVCTTCEHRCDVGVLDIPTTSQLASVLEEASVAALVALVRATTGERHVDVVGRAVQMLVDDGYDYNDDRLAQAVSLVTPRLGTASIRRLRYELTAYGKQGLIHRLTTVVTDGVTITAAHRDALVDVGQALGLGATHIHGMLAMVSAPVDA